MTESIPVFIYEDTFQLKREEATYTVYTGACPIDHTHSREFKGEKFLVNGKVRTVKMAETYATLQGPRKGTPIGLVFEDDDTNI